MPTNTLKNIKTDFIAAARLAGKLVMFTKSITDRLEPLRELPIVGGTVADIQDLISMLNDYCLGKYRKPPFTVIAAAIVILAYAASPIDIIPDQLPIIGAIDDLFVAKLLIDFCVDYELERYRAWRDDEVLNQFTEAE